MSDVSFGYYYSYLDPRDRNYADYLGRLHKSQISASNQNTERLLASNAANTKLMNDNISEMVKSNVASRNALSNDIRQVDRTLNARLSGLSADFQFGLSGLSRQLGYMSSDMSFSLARLNESVKESARSICDKLDQINDTLSRPIITQAREFYNMAQNNYIRGLFEEAIGEVQKAIDLNRTDPSSHFLLGQIYLYGLSEDYNVVDLDKSIAALRLSERYVRHYANNIPNNPARMLAAEICFYLGLALHAKAIDFYFKSDLGEFNNLLTEAKTSFAQSWDYSKSMLESLYNLARCKALSNDNAGAIQDLLGLLLLDSTYCIKTHSDPDFSDSLEKELFSQLKGQLYPQTKETYDKIIIKQMEYKGPYSAELNEKIKMYLPDNYDGSSPPYDMLMANIHFPTILVTLINEHQVYIATCLEEERRKQEEERLKKEEERRKQEEEENFLREVKKAEERRAEEKLADAKRYEQENKRIKERKDLEKRQAIMASFGKLLQFGIICFYYYVLFSTDIIVSDNSTSILLPAIALGLVSLLFGIISRIFRNNTPISYRNKEKKFISGFVFLIFAFGIASTAISVWQGKTLFYCIILAVIMTFIFLLKFWDRRFFLHAIGNIVITAGICLLVGLLINSGFRNNTVLHFLILFAFSFPGMVIISKVEY